MLTSVSSNRNLSTSNLLNQQADSGFNAHVRTLASDFLPNIASNPPVPVNRLNEQADSCFNAHVRTLASDFLPNIASNPPVPVNRLNEQADHTTDSPSAQIDRLVSSTRMRYTGQNYLQPMSQIPPVHSPQQDQWAKHLIKVVGSHLLSQL
jgi:hypothetical protein